MALFHHIEDDESLCELFTEIMRIFGHEIVSFHNGLKYLNYMNSDDYNCPVAIFTDIDMPVMDGYEMIEKVISSYPNRIIVVLSGNPDRTNVNEVHVFHHADKPFQPLVLEKLAKKLIAKKLSLGMDADLLDK